jgi:hypothetical protein
MNSFARLICNLASGVVIFGSVIFAPVAHSQQAVTGSANAEVVLDKKPKPDEISAARRQLVEVLKQKLLVNTLQVTYAVELKVADRAKLEQLAEMLTETIEVTIFPPSGNVLQGKATLNVSSATLQKYLANLKIGTTDLTKSSVRVVLSIDEFVGVATNMDASKPSEMTVNYSRDNSTFSDTSTKSSSSASAKSASARSNQNNVAMSGSDRVAVSGRQSSAVSSQGSSAIAERRSSSGAVAARDGYGGRVAASGVAQSAVAGSSSNRLNAANSSQYAGVSSSARALVDKSSSSSSRSSSSAQSFSENQNNVQQVTDRESYSMTMKMPTFDNAKRLAGNGLLKNELDGVFKANGLETVPENDLRAEGGRIISTSEIINNGRYDDFKSKFKQKKIVADVWAMGVATYSIVGTNDMGGTQCVGQVTVNAGFLDSSATLFSGSLPPVNAADRNGDQACQARLAVAMAKQLGDKLGRSAIEELNARQSRGRKMIVELYSAEGDVGRPVRRQFQDALYKAVGEDGAIDRGTGKWEIQIKGKTDDLLENILDKIGWAKADFRILGERICVGVEGPGVCPPEFRN